MAKTKINPKDTYMPLSEAKVWETDQNSAGALNFFISHPNAIRSTVNLFFVVPLVLLIRKVCILIYCFLKKEVISMYWFVAQQQSSAFRRQKDDLFYLKFSAESNGFSLNF